MLHWQKPDRVPPDVKFENYLYYLDRKREIL